MYVFYHLVICPTTFPFPPLLLQSYLPLHGPANLIEKRPSRPAARLGYFFNFIYLAWSEK